MTVICQLVSNRLIASDTTGAVLSFHKRCRQAGIMFLKGINAEIL